MVHCEGQCPSCTTEGNDRLSKTNDTKFEFISKEEEEWDFCVHIMWGKRTFLEWILALLKYKIWKVCCAVAQYYEFGCQTPDSPSIFIKNIKPDNDHY